jgi:hypothetical protein
MSNDSNVAFQAGFQGGASFDTLSNSVPGFAAPAIFTTVGKLHYPTYEEYSFQVEHALDPRKQTVLSLAYVGNHGYHEPVQNQSVNAFGVNNGKPGLNGVINFTGLPTTIPNASFGAANEVGNGAISNYNGFLVGVSRHTKSLTLNFNYTWSHALDEISNDGILGLGLVGANYLTPINPNNLRQNYGNADYDSRQNFTASYVYTLPYYGGPKLLTDGWQVSGTVFHHTGFPFSVVDSALQASNFGGSGFPGFMAAQVNGVKSCGGSAVFNTVTGVAANPCAIATHGNYVDPTTFGQQGRNQTVAPSYTDTDFSILKGFKIPIPHSDTGRFQVGAQFFNLFNHPNFGTPINDLNNPNFGAITTTVSTPTSILGSFLGGDASPRLTQLKGTITF